MRRVCKVTLARKARRETPAQSVQWAPREILVILVHKVPLVHRVLLDHKVYKVPLVQLVRKD